MGRVEGKVAIITGAASGLGEADARLLAAEGRERGVVDRAVVGLPVGLGVAKQEDFQWVPRGAGAAH